MAQTEQHVPRKDELAGSIPAACSTITDPVSGIDKIKYGGITFRRYKNDVAIFADDNGIDSPASMIYNISGRIEDAFHKLLADFSRYIGKELRFNFQRKEEI